MHTINPSFPTPVDGKDNTLPGSLDTGVDDSGNAAENKPHPLRSLAEFLAWLAAIIIVTNLIHRFVFHPFYVIGQSMEHSFQEGNYLFVEKVSYRFSDPERGDVIVFTPPWDAQNIQVGEIRDELGGVRFVVAQVFSKINGISQFLGGTTMKQPPLETRQYIKRVIGLPGETIRITEEGVVIVLNDEHPKGFVLEEPYIVDKTGGSLTMTLEDEEYFVMGDNRPNSIDSRGSTFGKATNPHAVPKNSIEGKVLLRLWPLDKVSVISSPGYEE